MSHNETTTSRVAKLAAKGLRYPESLTTDEIKIICASALTQAEDKSEEELKFSSDNESENDYSV